jgi:uncharacterized membrane protein YphA (DoxX/SURF4 family)
MNVALWVVQILLGALFIFAGAMKFVMPVEAMQDPIAFPGWFLRFIGAAELAGGIGLILPSLLRIKPALTPLAAAGLVIIMIGATAIGVATGPIAMASIPLVVGIAAAFVAYGRWRLVPLMERSAR